MTYMYHFVIKNRDDLRDFLNVIEDATYILWRTGAAPSRFIPEFPETKNIIISLEYSAYSKYKISYLTVDKSEPVSSALSKLETVGEVVDSVCESMYRFSEKCFDRKKINIEEMQRRLEVIFSKDEAIDSYEPNAADFYGDF